MNPKTFPLLTALILCSNAFSGDNLIRGFAVYYQQKLYFTDFADFANANPAAPDLDPNARIHGAEIEGFISNHIIFGMYGNGMLKRSENSTGSSDWGGGIAALFGQYRVYSDAGFFASAGFGLGCGRISYISSNSEGTNTQTIVSDAIYGEPLINLGYSHKNKILLRCQASYIAPGLGENYRTGTPNLSNPFPFGPVISLSLGYRFPYFGQ